MTTETREARAAYSPLFRSPAYTIFNTMQPFVSCQSVVRPGTKRCGESMEAPLASQATLPHGRREGAHARIPQLFTHGHARRAPAEAVRTPSGGGDVPAPAAARLAGCLPVARAGAPAVAAVGKP